MHKILCFALLILPLILMAQAEDPVVINGINDSLVQAREAEVQSEYGIRDSNTLRDAASKLEIDDFGAWKRALFLEPENTFLDDRTLKQLEISPYRAFLALQTVDYGFNELSTITEICAGLNIPIKKFKAMLGNDDPLDKSWDHQSIQALGISLEHVKTAEEEFREDRVLFGWNVTMVGMLVVFSALIITSIIISQLVHLNRESKRDVLKLSSEDEVKKAPKDMSRYTIAAVVTALHLHSMELEERRKMVLTFRRTPANQWRASAILTMPNRELNSRGK